MKPNIKQIALFAVASTGLTAASPAATLGGTSQNISLQIATHQTVAGTYEKDDSGKVITPKVEVYENEWSNSDDTILNYEYVSKIQTVKFGNKQILEILVAAGRIPSITGWSIKLIGVLDPLDGGDSQPFLVKKDTTPVWIGDLLSFEEGPASASAEKYTDVFNDTNDTEVETGSSHWLALMNVSLEIPSEDVDFELTGLNSGSDKLKKIGDDYFWIDSGGTLKVIGTADFDDGDLRVAEGTLTTSGSTILEDVSGYPFPIVD